MRSVADAQQAREMPLPQPVDLHREQLHLIPAFEFSRSIAQIRRNPRDGVAQHVQPVALDFLERTFPNDQPGLKIIAPVDQDQHLPIVDISQHLLGIAPSPR